MTVEVKDLIKKYIEVYNAEFLQDVNLDFFIEDAALTVSQSKFGALYPKAMALFTMHNMASVKLEDDREVTSKTIGPLSVTYGSSGVALSSTKYGRAYAELDKTYSSAVGVFL